MSEAFIHLSVLGEEAPEALVGDPDGLYVDGTFGRGGHSRRILEKLSPKGRLIAFDRDPQAVEVARSWTDPRFTIIHEPFSTMTESLAAIGVHQADGIFLDIGVSSPQIDDAARGFSFRFDGPLDMRMDTTRGMTAAEWLAQAEERDLRHVISLCACDRRTQEDEAPGDDPRACGSGCRRRASQPQGHGPASRHAHLSGRAHRGEP